MSENEAVDPELLQKYIGFSIAAGFVIMLLVDTIMPSHQAQEYKKDDDESEPLL